MPKIQNRYAFFASKKRRIQAGKLKKQEEHQRKREYDNMHWFQQAAKEETERQRRLEQEARQETGRQYRSQTEKCQRDDQKKNHQRRIIIKAANEENESDESAHKADEKTARKKERQIKLKLLKEIQDLERKITEQRQKRTRTK